MECLLFGLVFMKLQMVFATEQSLFWPPGDMKKSKFLLSTGNHVLFGLKSLFNRMPKSMSLRGNSYFFQSPYRIITF